jgi:hypothetical protein
MRILFDMNTPAPLAWALRGHDVRLVRDLGWQQLHNGALLERAEEDGFEALVTCDQNIRYQQNFTGRRIAVVILSTNHWQLLRPVASWIATPGEVRTIDVTQLAPRGS